MNFIKFNYRSAIVLQHNYYNNQHILVWYTHDITRYSIANVLVTASTRLKYVRTLQFSVWFNSVRCNLGIHFCCLFFSISAVMLKILICNLHLLLETLCDHAHNNKRFSFKFQLQLQLQRYILSAPLCVH